MEVGRGSNWGCSAIRERERCIPNRVYNFNQSSKAVCIKLSQIIWHYILFNHSLFRTAQIQTRGGLYDLSPSVRMILADKNYGTVHEHTNVQINMYATDGEPLYTRVIKQGDTEEPVSLMIPKLKVMERQKTLLSSYSTSTSHFSTLASIKTCQKRTDWDNIQDF
jgi:hypothetical protein